MDEMATYLRYWTGQGHAAEPVDTEVEVVNGQKPAPVTVEEMVEVARQPR